jgi:hypothetical protein
VLQGLAADGFEQVRRMSAWGLLDAANTQFDEKRVLGRKCKQLIDAGRCHFIMSCLEAMGLRNQSSFDSSAHVADASHPDASTNATTIPAPLASPLISTPATMLVDQVVYCTQSESLENVALYIRSIAADASVSVPVTVATASVDTHTATGRL